MSSYPNVPLVNSMHPEKILGMGRTGVVIRQDDIAVKLPLRWSTSDEFEVQSNIEALQHEQAIYLQLGKSRHIVEFLGSSETSTQLSLMENGDLRRYLSQHKASDQLQLSWFREMARGLAYIHDHRIIVADIASRNFLLDSNLSIKFCDFTESTKLPRDTYMKTANDGGYTVQTDIGQLGAVIYEIVTGQRCEFDIWKDVPGEATRGSWPRRERLPSTRNVWLGAIIEKCWTQGGFRNAYKLLGEVEAVEVENGSSSQRESPEPHE
ncbi:serine/threonine protein kinase [Aspergillus carlsbadensis]|nr:serine/threonine protein kinase [Aspergillus carlsbadensis]